MHPGNLHSCSEFQLGFRTVTSMQDLTVRTYILRNPPAGSWDLQVTLEVIHWGPVRVLFRSSSGSVWVLFGSCLCSVWVLCGSCLGPVWVRSVPCLGPVHVLSGSCATSVRVLVGSCSGLFQILVRSCSNPMKVLSFIPSQLYKTIRYRLYASSAQGLPKPSLICV
jgi:hypothetical protein